MASERVADEACAHGARANASVIRQARRLPPARARAALSIFASLSVIAACKPAPPPAISAPTAVASAASSAPPSASAPSTTSTSTPLSAFGCEVRASLVPDRATIVVGEPVYLTVRLSTSCAQSLAVLDGGDYRNRFGRADSFELRITDARGKPLPVIDAGPSFGGLTGPRTLAVGTDFEKRLLLAHWVSLDAPGRYQIQVRKPLWIGQTMTPDEGDKITLPLAVTSTLEVRAASPAALGEVIDRLALGLASSTDRAPEESLAALSTMHDTRIVTHFVRLVNGPRMTLRPGGIMGLSPYETDEALAGLVTALDAEGMRLIAAQSLASSVHPKAWDRLWTLRTDPDANVRLTVLHALATREGPDVLAKIVAFQKDPAEIVAKEAARYEKERKARR